MMICISQPVMLLALLLLAARPDATSARLLAPDSGRRASLLPVQELELPVFQLLTSVQAKTTSGMWALKGIPTHYKSTGCRKVTKVYGKVSNTLGATSMTVSKCFAFCSKRKGLSYFGITKGNDCWCASAIDASTMSDSDCEKKCPGNPTESCGGIVGTSMYTMFDCTAATPQEIAKEKEEQKQALLTSYGSFSGESCGQGKGNTLQLDNKGYISGTLDTCKIACWEAKGAESCHGFTYDSILSKCTFHLDVTDGPVDKIGHNACYFKIP